MEETYARNQSELLPARHEAEGSARVVMLDPSAPDYTCSVCRSSWQYQQVRNTGRCPSCGSGLLRDTGRP